jgi:putative ABC transport system permease protein
MTWITRLVGGIVGLLRRTRQGQDLDLELQAFLETAIDDKVRGGMTREAATRAARLELGSAAAVKDHVRDVGWEAVVETTWQDVRYAARALRRSPVFVAVAVVSLAVGIGANAAIFTLINTLMLRSLPVARPEQLVELLSRYPGEPRMSSFSWRHYEHFRDNNQSFSDLIAVSRARLQVTAAGVEPETIDGEYVAGNFFTALGVRPALGRVIEPRDDHVDSSSAASAVVSWSYWASRLHADPAIVGKMIVVNDVPATVVGVTPREFFGLQVGIHPSVWLPAALEPALQKPSRRMDGTLGVAILARLRSGVTIEEAVAEMRVLDRYRLEDFAKSRSAAFARGFTIELAPAAAGLAALRDRFSDSLVALMAVVAVLLLLACTNLASLLLARAAARQHEMALRVSLGAGRARLVRQVLTESLLLSAMGGLASVVLAAAGAETLVRIMLTGSEFLRLPQRIEIHTQPDLQVLGFTTVVVVLTTLLCGAAPAWQALTSAPALSLRASGAGQGTRRRRVFGQSLVVAQVALSILLLTVAAVFVQHLSNLRNQDLGFQRASLLLVTLDPARSGYAREQLFVPYQNLLARLHQIPSVRSVTLSGLTPISGAGASRFIEVEGFQEAPEARRYVPLNWVGPRYFDTFGTPLLAGRDFAFSDRGGPPVAIVNQAMARHYFADRNPIGGRFQLVGPSNSGITGVAPGQVYEVVGVAADAKYLDLREPPPRTIYLNAFQEPRVVSRFALRTSGDPAAVVSDVRRIVREDLKTVTIADVTTMDALVDAWIVAERMIAMLSSVFGGLGAALAALGLYGLLAYTVSRRTNEIGIRMALGATRANISRMVLRDAFGLVCAGVVVGVPLALLSRRAASRLVADLPSDTVGLLVLATTAMFVIALGAAYVPACRASNVEPVDAFRQ